jgi:hypothetical protein
MSRRKHRYGDDDTEVLIPLAPIDWGKARRRLEEDFHKGVLINLLTKRRWNHEIYYMKHRKTQSRPQLTFY